MRISDWSSDVCSSDLVFQESLVGRRRRMVELIDDHDIEVIGRQVLEPPCTEALNGGEDVLEASRAIATDPKLAKGRVAECVPEGGQALVKDFFAVGDEKQARPWQPFAQPLVVQRSHDCLARPGG